VTVNDQPAHSAGQRVVPFQDPVQLDGKRVEGWESLNAVVAPVLATSEGTFSGRSSNNKNSVFEYIKYWKPVGVTCTTDRTIRDNILDQLEHQDGYRSTHRVYPVGRLDKYTSGLILLTSDGRLPNSALRGRFKQPKTYQVTADRAIAPHHLQALRDGVVITTQAQRDHKRGPPLTVPTLPCHVQVAPHDPCRLRMTIVEGRNRQIRKMLEAVGYRVVKLHRITFMSIALDPLQRPGDWQALSEGEMEIVQKSWRRRNKDNRKMTRSEGSRKIL
jgi:23S rRNA pseudouridine2604 synthase